MFFGGGTPTLLSPADLGSVVAAIDDEFGLAPGAEVTTEANPDSVDAGRPGAAARRRHQPGLVRDAVGRRPRARGPGPHPRPAAGARRWSAGPAQAGFEQVSLDLIYGTPGESLADWERSLDAALACEPDHVSAYSLIVEDGTALARRVRRGEVPMPDEDDLADKYLLADERLAAAGLGWYEVSNWARDERGPLPAQPALLDRRRLVGRRPRRALPRRRACGGGTSSTPRRTPTGSPPG